MQLQRLPNTSSGLAGKSCLRGAKTRPGERVTWVLGKLWTHEAVEELRYDERDLLNGGSEGERRSPWSAQRGAGR